MTRERTKDYSVIEDLKEVVRSQTRVAITEAFELGYKQGYDAARAETAELDSAYRKGYEDGKNDR